MWVLEYLMEGGYLAGLTNIEVATKAKRGIVRRRRRAMIDKKLELHYYPTEGSHKFYYKN